MSISLSLSISLEIGERDREREIDMCEREREIEIDREGCCLGGLSRICGAFGYCCTILLPLTTATATTTATLRFHECFFLKLRE